MTPYEIRIREKAKRAVALYKRGYISHSVYKDILDDLTYASSVDTLNNVESQLQIEKLEKENQNETEING